MVAARAVDDLGQDRRLELRALGGGSGCRPSPGIAAIGAASPKAALGETTIPRQASARIVPALYALGCTHAQVSRGARSFSAMHISSVAPASPPGVSSSSTTASAPSRCARARRRSRLARLTSSIGPRSGMTATCFALRQAGTGSEGGAATVVAAASRSASAGSRARSIARCARAARLVDAQSPSARDRSPLRIAGG